MRLASITVLIALAIIAGFALVPAVVIAEEEPKKSNEPKEPPREGKGTGQGKYQATTQRLPATSVPCRWLRRTGWASSPL